MKKILLIVNPCSGKRKSRKKVDDIVKSLSDKSNDITVKQTEYSGHASKIAEEYGESFDEIMCSGGDGTLNEVINGIMALNKRPKLTYIPNGTTNDSAKTLSIPITIIGLRQMVKNNTYNKCDIGLFNNRHFFCAVSFGFGARASFTTKQSLKNKIGHFAYILSAITHLNDIKPIKMNIEYDGNIIADEFLFGAVINTRSVGGIFKLDKNIFRINDGKFEILLVKKLSNIIELPIMLLKLQQKKYDGKHVILIQADKIQFSSPNKVSWLIDGEFAGDLTDVSVLNENKAIEICCPDSVIFNK